MKNYHYEKVICVCDAVWGREAISMALQKLVYVMFDTVEANQEFLDEFHIDFVPTESLNTIGIRIRWGVKI